MKKPPSWMNSAPPADVTASMPSGFSRGFKRFTKPKPKRRGKPPVYQNEAIINPLKEIWLAANLPCSKRLKVILPIWLPGYVEFFGELSSEVTNALLNISPPTIDRILKPDPNPLHKTGPEHHKARNPLTKTNTHQNQSMGRITPRLPRSRYRRSLRRFHRRNVRQYHRLRRYRHRLDRTTRRLGKGRNRGPGTNQTHRKNPPIPHPRLRLLITEGSSSTTTS